MIDTHEYYDERADARARMRDRIARLSLDDSARGASVSTAWGSYLMSRHLLAFVSPRELWEQCYSEQRKRDRKAMERNAQFLKAWMPGFVRAITEPRKIDEMLNPLPNGASNDKVRIDPK